MIRRVVAVQFSQDATAEQIRRYVETVEGFPEQIPQIRKSSRGLHVSDGDDSVAYSHVSLLDFDTMEDLQGFLKHPVHLAAAAGLFREVVAKRVIVNYEI